VALWLVSTTGVAAEITLSTDSDITIEERGPFDSAEGMLAELLEKYLLLALDKSQLSGPGEKVRFVLESRAGNWRDLPREHIKDVADADAFEISIAAGQSPTIAILGQTPLAVGFGVMHFLDKHMNILWAFPGPGGLCFPDHRVFRLFVGKECVSPWVAVRVLSGLDLRPRSADDKHVRGLTGILREHRGFFFADDYFKSLRLRAGAVTHNMIHIFPVAECRDGHPEVFPITTSGERFIPPLKDRRREDKSYQAWHPCYTNSKTLQVAVAKGRQTFDSGALFYSLGINDGRRVRCQCESCTRVGWPQSYYGFVNRVAEALQDCYPPQMVGVLAYGDVGIPPADLKLRENVLVNVAGMRKDVWDGLAPALGTYEYIYGAGYLIPNLPLDAFQENVRYYQQRGLRMYRAEFYPLWAFDAPKAYVLSRLLWDPDRDVFQLLHEFCDRAFGQAGSAMAGYYEHLAAIRKDDVRPGQFTPIWNREWPFGEPLQMLHCPPDLHQRLAVCLDEARRRQLTEAQRKRVDMVAAFTEFSEVYYQMDRLKETVFAGRFDARTVQSEADRLMARRESVTALFHEHPEWFAGSAVTADTLDDRQWPTLPTQHQLEAAVTTAQVALQQAAYVVRPQRLSPLMRASHPWYKPTQFLPMEIQPDRVRGGFRFESAENVLIGQDEDPRHVGKPKAQWLHATARDLLPAQRTFGSSDVNGRGAGLPLGALRSLARQGSKSVAEDVLYGLHVELTGRGGLLRCTAQGSTRTPDRQKFTFGQCLIPFPGDDTHAATRRIVFDPRRYLAATKAPTTDNASVVFQLHLVWRADRTDSHLAGDVQLVEMTESRMERGDFRKSDAADHLFKVAR
jgi:hypothetical protein